MWSSILSCDQILQESNISSVHSFFCKLTREVLETGLINELSINKVISEFLNSWGPHALVLYCILSFSSTYIICYHKNAKQVLFLAEMMTWLSSLLPMCLPWKPVRFFCGLQAFTSSMSLHGRICENIQQARNSISCDNLQALLTQEIKLDSDDKLLFPHLLRTYFYNLQPKLASKKAKRIPSLGRMLYFLYICLFADLSIWSFILSCFLSLLCCFLSLFFALSLPISSIYLSSFRAMQEGIPMLISVKSQYTMKAFVAGVWVLYTMDITYNCGIMFLDLEGSPLPYDLRHRHPLLSTSLAEFWGSRWNPIIGKLLQESFYKPVRRLDLSRGTAMLCCFTGSAVLHAFPQYISTYSLTDASMMFTFFFSQGLLVLVEQFASRYLGMKECFHHQIPIMAPFQWACEIIIIAFFLLFIYIITESSFGLFEWKVLVTVSILMFGSVYFIFCSSADERLKRSVSGKLGVVVGGFGGKRKSRQLTVLIGWFWTVSCIITTLPLFSLPVYNAADSFYSRSFVIGPILRVLGLSL